MFEDENGKIFVRDDWKGIDRGGQGWEPEEREWVKVQVSALVKDSRDLLAHFIWVWVMFIGGTHHILLEKEHKSKYFVHPSATKMYRDLEEDY